MVERLTAEQRATLATTLPSWSILPERDALYRLADATVETSGRSVEESLKQLQNMYNTSKI